MFLKMTYVWERYYFAAMRETDNARLQDRITVAMFAIEHRITNLRREGTTTERLAIADALRGLTALRKETPPKNYAIDEEHLMELCEQAAGEQDSKKLLELTHEIDRLLTDACEAWERMNPSQIRPFS